MKCIIAEGGERGEAKRVGSGAVGALSGLGGKEGEKDGERRGLFSIPHEEEKGDVKEVEEEEEEKEEVEWVEIRGLAEARGDSGGTLLLSFF